MVEESKFKKIGLIVVVFIVIAILVSSPYYIKKNYDFDDDFVFMASVYQEGGNILVMFEDGTYYFIDYQGNPNESGDYDSEYENTNEREIQSLLNYIDFWFENYHIFDAMKGNFDNESALSQIFDEDKINSLEDYPETILIHSGETSQSVTKYGFMIDMEFITLDYVETSGPGTEGELPDLEFVKPLIEFWNSQYD